MPTIVGILTFMSKIHFVLSWVEHEKSFLTSGPVGTDLGARNSSETIQDSFKGSDKHKFSSKMKNSIFLSKLNICQGCSVQWGGSFEYMQHMFWLLNKKIRI